jgi:hypothetical protein
VELEAQDDVSLDDCRLSHAAASMTAGRGCGDGTRVWFQLSSADIQASGARDFNA